MNRIEARLLGPGDEDVLLRTAPDLFANPVDPALARAFLAEAGHHIAVALEDGVAVAFASGVRYVHPDKPWALWSNEVSTAPTHRRRGLGRLVVGALLDAARARGCVEAWVGTERANAAAIGLYSSLGGSREGEDGILLFVSPLRTA